jgi:uncharacterized membrane protein YdjX (TVP38/TMEM64 family)
VKLEAPPKLVAWLLVAGLIAIALALAWQFTPLSQLADPERIARRLERLERYEWSPVVFVGAYLVGGLVMFPVTVLSAPGCLTPVKAILISFTGIMLSAAYLHWVGAWLGESTRRSSWVLIKSA